MRSSVMSASFLRARRSVCTSVFLYVCLFVVSHGRLCGHATTLFKITRVGVEGERRMQTNHVALLTHKAKWYVVWIRSRW